MLANLCSFCDRFIRIVTCFFFSVDSRSMLLLKKTINVVVCSFSVSVWYYSLPYGTGHEVE